MYRKNLVAGYSEEEIARKAMDSLDRIMCLSDAYVTAEQSKVVVDVLNKLHEAKSISDYDYVRNLRAVLDANGFDVR